MFLLWSMFFATSTASAQSDFKYEEKLHELAKPYLDNSIFQAASVGIVQDGQTYFLNFGKLSPKQDEAPTEDSVYEIGSITKVFTSILLADAVANRKSVELDKPLSSAFPELTNVNASIADKVTFRQIAQHMSGLPRMPDNIAPKDPNNPFADYNSTLLDQFVQSVKLEHEPGTHSEYSNFAVGWLGYLLAKQTKSSYEQLLKERVLTPLEMNSTCIALDDKARSQLAPPHNSALMPDHLWDFDTLAGAGAIRSTTTDMVKFIQANLESSNNEIGKAIDLAWQQSLKAAEGQSAKGLGWMIASDGSTRWHNGQTGGYHSMILINRKAEAGLVFLCNTATMEVDTLAENMFQAILGLNVQPRSFSKEVAVEEAVLKRLVGKYELAPGVVFDITSNSGRLMAQLTGQQALRVYPESDTVWNYKEVEAQLQFDLPEDGPATKVTLHQNGRVMPAGRIANP